MFGSSILCGLASSSKANGPVTYIGGKLVLLIPLSAGGDQLIECSKGIAELCGDGIAPVPGVLCLTVFSEDNKIRVSGCIDVGYPKPSGVHQAMLMLPPGVQWDGLRLKAELEVKGVRHPVQWACRQKINSDGSLTLRHNYKPDQPLV